jgi:hypothetical protein
MSWCVIEKNSKKTIWFYYFDIIFSSIWSWDLSLSSWVDVSLKKNSKKHYLVNKEGIENEVFQSSHSHELNMLV